MDDFSFPTIQTNQELSFPHFAMSPIWYRRSFSSTEEVADALKVLSPTMSDNEEKMDMLWEDFNEELLLASGELKKKIKVKGAFKSGSFEELHVPKRKSSLLPRKKLGLMVMVKALKMLFSARKASPVCKNKLFS